MTGAGDGSSDEGQWLIRTQQNVLAGPFVRSQIIELIRKGQLGLQDEVCPSNGYWVFLHEREEVSKLLHIEINKANGEHLDEVTQTQTDTTTDVLDSQSEVALRIAEGTELTAVLRAQSANPITIHARPRLAMSVRGTTQAKSSKGERFSLLRTLVLLLLCLVGITLVAVLNFVGQQN